MTVNHLLTRQSSAHASLAEASELGPLQVPVALLIDVTFGQEGGEFNHIS